MGAESALSPRAKIVLLEQLRGTVDAIYGMMIRGTITLNQARDLIG